MKRIFYFWMVAVLFYPLSLMSQSPSINKLRAEVKQINDVLPISTVKGVTLSQYYIENDNVIIVNIVDENYVRFEDYVDKENHRRKALLQSYKTNPVLTRFANLVVNCDMNILVIYEANKTGRTSELLLTTKQLRQCIK